MSTESYVPNRGDVIKLNFNPTQGHEQAGYRPALVLPPIEFNRRTKLVIVLAIANQAKGYSVEEPIPTGYDVTGVVLCHQIRTLDWKARAAGFLCSLPLEIVDLAYARFSALMPELIDPDEVSDE